MDRLRSAHGADLAGIEGGSAGSRHAVASVDFAHREEPADAGLPVGIRGDTAVVVLGADRDLQRLRAQIHMMIRVEVDRRLIHVRQSLDRGAEKGTGLLQVGVCFLRQAVERNRPVPGILPEVQIDAPAAQDRLPVDQQVDDGGAAEDLLHIEGPLVALQEDHREHLALVPEVFLQEFPLISAFLIRGVEARQHLHIGPRHVPARGDRGHAELPFGEVFTGCSRCISHTAAAQLGLGIDAVAVHARRPAGREDHVAGPEKDETIRTVLRSSTPVQAEHTPHRAVRAEQPDRLQAVQDRDAGPADRPLQRLGHQPGRVRAGTRGPPAAVVVRLVSHVLTVLIAGKRHPELHQIVEPPRRQRRLAERRVPVDRTAGEQILRHRGDAVRIAPRQRQLVVGLLVRSGVP